MYQEISKLIMYGNMDQDCILYKFADLKCRSLPMRS